MNRRTFFKKLGLLGAAAVVAPKIAVDVVSSISVPTFGAWPGTWSNDVSTASPLSMDSLRKAIYEIRKYQSDSGERLFIRPTHYIILPEDY